MIARQAQKNAALMGGKDLQYASMTGTLEISERVSN
jgi:hypothetical protein